jgi:flagellar assembly protein FliH
MTSSTDGNGGGFTRLPTPELRSGDLTRFGGPGVLGDSVTELTLAALTDEARSAAQSQGYAVGWAEGRREAAAEAAREAAARDQQLAAAQQQWTARQEAAVHALTTAARALSAATAEAQALVGSKAVELARELTEAIVGHELRVALESGETAADLAARVLAEAPADAPYVVRVHPDVAAAVTGLIGVRAVPDASLHTSDAIVEVDEQVVDLRVSTAIARVRAVLG